MRKILVTTLVVVCSLTVKAQSYIGFQQDNYAGVQGVLFNPASIVDSNFRTDINLFSFNTTVTNDYYGVTFLDVFKSGYNIETQAKLFPSSANNFIISSDVMGPAFMFNIKPKHAVAVFTRGRALVNINDINGELFNQLSDDFNTNEDFSLNAGHFNMTGNAWGELGVSYAGVLLDKGKHFLKGGITVKYLQGIANSYTKGSNVTVNYNYNSDLPTTNTIATTGNLTYGGSNDFEKSFENFDFDSNSQGFGGDFGLVYEYRPESENKLANGYKFKVGLSVTDLGAINYKLSDQKTYDLNKTVTEAQYQDAGSLGDFLEQNYTVTQTKGAVKAVLPTAIHANVDWNFYRKFYVNLNGDISAANRTALNATAVANVVSVTPRYETKFFSFYLPFNYMQYRGLMAGTGLRVGPLMLGSGSLLTNLISKESKGFDVYLGLKVPIYKSRKTQNTKA